MKICYGIIFVLVVVWVTFFHYTMDYEYERQRCPAEGVVALLDVWRMEDVLWGYTTLLAIHINKLTGKRVLVSSWVKEKLGKYFYKLSLNDFQGLERCESSLTMREAIGSSQLKDALEEKGDTVIVEFISNPLGYTAPVWYSKEVLSDFALFHEYVLDASSFVDAERRELHAEGSQLICLWVSNRDEFLEYGQEVPDARTRFFRQAMEDFREGRWRRPLFLAVNNLFWARRRLDKAVIIPDWADLGHSLALLSLCNHTVVDGSVLSLWAALFSPGGKYVYSLPEELRPRLELTADWYVWADRNKTSGNEEMFTT